jgi:hypothetical protein
MQEYSDALQKLGAPLKQMFLPRYLVETVRLDFLQSIAATMLFRNTKPRASQNELAIFYNPLSLTYLSHHVMIFFHYYEYIHHPCYPRH